MRIKWYMYALLIVLLASGCSKKEEEIVRDPKEAMLLGRWKLYEVYSYENDYTSNQELKNIFYVFREGPGRLSLDTYGNGFWGLSYAGKVEGNDLNLLNMIGGPHSWERNEILRLDNDTLCLLMDIRHYFKNISRFYRVKESLE